MATKNLRDKDIINDINKTIEYLKKYNCQIDGDLIKKCLISNKIYPKKDIDKALSKYDNEEGKYYSTEKIKVAQSIVKNFANNKNILMVGITGSVAIGKAKKDDDIDLLIITKTDSLWKERLLMRWRVFYKKIPHRKYMKVQESDQLCFNLWLDEGNLLVPKEKQNLRNAIDLVNIVTIVNKNKILEKFVGINKHWAKKYVANQLDKFKDISQDKSSKKLVKMFLNFIWYIPQKIYLSTKGKNNLVTANQAFFHN